VRQERLNNKNKGLIIIKTPLLIRFLKNGKEQGL